MSRTCNQGQVVLENADETIWYVNVIETYEGDHPDFRTVKVVLDVGSDTDDDDDSEVEIEITQKDCLRLAQMFLNTSMASFWNQPRA